MMPTAIGKVFGWCLIAWGCIMVRTSKPILPLGLVPPTFDLIRQEFLPRNQADVELFSYGQKHLFNRSLEHVSKKERLQLLDAKYSTVADAKAAFSVHLARALVQSYGLEERRPELVRLIEAEKLWQKTLDYAIEYWSDKPVNSTR